jgi:Predicted membrane protein (DUF2339)
MTDDRLSDFEQRLTAIERRLDIHPTPVVDPRPKDDPPTPLPGLPAASRNLPDAAHPPRATNILGWGGMAALVLATAYLIRLAIDAGWLTPARQVGLAAIVGLALILAGFALVTKYPHYASLFPAAGIVVLFLANYGAHLYHGLIGPLPALAGVMGISVAALALGHIFKGPFYALFAVVGSYTGPLLLPHMRAADPVDLMIYFSAWSVLFCWYATVAKQRQVYLLAAYLSFLSFDIVWRAGGGVHWNIAVIFQFIQLILFTVAAATYSVKNRAPLEQASARWHLPLLLLFYFLQYTILREHLPLWAPWIAFCSMGVLLVVYALAQSVLAVPTPASRWIVTVYSAVVLFHAGYLELISDRWRPLIGLVFLAGMGAYALSRPKPQVRAMWPLFAVAGLVLLHNYVRLVFGWELSEVPGHRVLLPLYAITLYAAYWLVRDHAEYANFTNVFLYMGHIGAMVGAIHLLKDRLAVSFVWGLLAVMCLVLALASGNKLLGRSALFVFAASAAKVWLFDLSGATPFVRIGCLVILGITLYIGGLLYQKMDVTQRPSLSHPS